MILVKKLTSREILELVALEAAKTVPEGLQGCLTLTWDDDNGLEIHFLEDKHASGPAN